MTERDIDQCAPTPDELGIDGSDFQLVRSALAEILSNGLDRKTIAGCVRIRSFERYGGGLKSPLVGGMTINLGLSLKVGGEELDHCWRMFPAANAAAEERLGQHVFPTLHVLLEVEHDSYNRLLVMDHLRRYESLFDVVFKREANLDALERAVGRGLALLDIVHGLPEEATNDAASHTSDLYFRRIRDSLVKLSGMLPWVQTARKKGLVVLDEKTGERSDIPPLDELVEALEAKLPEPPVASDVVLHGDPHLGNLMLKRSGKGYSVRLIDPNPSWGTGDYLYDVGKLYHFACDVGLVRHDEKYANVVVETTSDIPQVVLRGGIGDAPAAVQERMGVVAKALDKWLDQKAPLIGDEPKGPRFHIAVATSTIVTAPLLNSPEAKTLATCRALLHLDAARRALGF